MDLEEDIEKLKNYVDEHFGLEEKYMTISNYPESKAHEQLHREFSHFLLDLESTQNSVLQSGRLCNKLSTWFVQHIKVF